MSLLAGSLAALQTGQQTFANQYDKRRQREALKISREQQDIVNTEENERLQLKGARETLGNIAQHTGNVTEEQDWAKLYEERPELIVNLSNQRPEFNVFTKADGTEERAELVGYDKKGDLYIPMVKRADTGEIVPMTGERTELGDDNVVQLTQAQFNDHLKSRWAGGISKGALRDNDGILYTGAKTVNEYASRAATAQLREASLDIVGNDPNKSPAQKAAFYQVVNDTDDMDALKQVFTSVGGDVDALIAESDKAARLEWEASAQGQEEKKRLEAKEAEEQRTPLQRALNPRNRPVMGRLAEERMSMLGITDPEEYDMLSTVKDAVEESGIASAGGKSGFLFKDQTNEDYERNTAAEKFYDRQSNQVAIAKAIVRRPELKREFETLGPLAFFEKYGKDIDQLAKPQRPQGSPSQGGYTPEGTTVSGRSSAAAAPQIATRPPFELTVDNIREAIKNQTAKPTQEQVTAISSFLDSKGIETDADLITATKNGSVVPEDARFVAYVMGMTHSGTTSDKMNETQKLLNAMTYGDRDVGVQEQEQIKSYRSQAATARATLELEAAKYDGTQAEGIAQKGAEAVLKIQQDLGLMDENGNPTAKDFEADGDDALKIARRIPGFTTRLMRAKGPLEAEAGMVALNQMLGLYMQAKAASDPNGTFSGENFKDIFRPEPNGSINFDANNVRVAEKNASGMVTKVAYVRDGVLSQAVTVTDLKGDEASVAGLLIAAAKKNEENGRTAPK
jgi:hypothetical protein